MAVTAEQLREEVNASTAEDDEVFERCVQYAFEVVSQYAESAFDEIPTLAFDEAVLATAVDHYHRRNAPNGVTNQAFTAGDGGQALAPVRISRDPLAAARPILGQWILPVTIA